MNAAATFIANELAERLRAPVMLTQHSDGWKATANACMVEIWFPLEDGRNEPERYLAPLAARLLVGPLPGAELVAIETVLDAVIVNWPQIRIAA